MNCKSWARVMTLGMAVAVVCATTVPARAQNAGADVPAAQTVQKDLQQLRDVLNDENAKPEDRDEAARRLLSRQSDEARGILKSVLMSAGNRNGQLAVARALADDPRPDPQFIDALFALIGPDRPLTDAATSALAVYKGNAVVLLRLISLATPHQQREQVRIACIRALGSLSEKRAAETLIGLVTRDEESPAVRNAAADALVQLTGLRENGRDIQRWQQWWGANANKSEDEWRQALLNDRAARLDLLQARYTQLTDEVRAIFSEQYQVTADAQKPDVLLRYLRAGEPVIRAVGARLIFDDVVSNRTIPPAVREQLRKMVGDSSTDVRLEVATALGALNDEKALEPLLAQLAQESSPDVKAAIARAIAPIPDPELRAVPELLKLLRDPSFVAAEAGANALWDMGDEIRANPAMARTVADALRAVLDERSAAPGSARFRAAVVQAVVPLREKSLLPVFYRLLTSRGQSADVRRWALKGLGELGDPNTSDVVINSLEDPEASVRLQAVTALERVGSYENGQILYRRMNPAEEADPSVRDEAWRVLLTLLGKGAPKQQLVAWADRFQQDPAKRVAVLQVLEKRQVEDQESDRLPYTRQNIGAGYMDLGQPAEAAPYFRQARDYFVEQKNERFTTSLTRQLITALLRSKQYADAITFGASLIERDPAEQQTVGPAVRSEVERLQRTGDFASALALIAETRKMRPRLEDRYAHDLDALEGEVKQRMPAEQSTRPATLPVAPRDDR